MLCSLCEGLCSVYIASMAFNYYIKRLTESSIFVALHFKYQLLRDYSKYCGEKVCALLIHLCVAESVAQQRDYVMNCRLWFCHGRTWGLCSPSGLWGSPWPAATYLRRTADPSVTGQLTGKGRDDSCSS